MYNGFETFDEAIKAHNDSLRGRENGKRLVLSGMDLSGIDLSDVDFRGMDLRGAYTAYTNFSGSNFSGMDLTRMDLTGANLSNTDLSNANLQRVEAAGTNFSGSNLSGANLAGANLIIANLDGVNLEGAILPAGYTWEVYLSEVVPELCTAGGASLEAVAEAWNCHSWTNCPMSVAFGVRRISDIPPRYRQEVEQFVHFFDMQIIPRPLVTTG